MIGLRRAAKYAGISVLVLGVLVGAGFAVGVLGVPAVDGVENRFADVNDTATTVDTAITVANPNPLGVSTGGLSIDYGIAMNDVPMANGSKEGLSVGSGQSTVPFTTTIATQRIPQWWYTHVDRGETTDVAVDVDLSHSLLGGRTVSVPQEQTIETDLLGQFNDSTTRPIDVGAPLVSDPVLYLNETAASYGENVTPERTPLDLSFTVYNPKPYPYAVSEVGYEIRMNGVTVGEGASERAYSIPPRSTRTIEADTVVRNQHLDEWWVSHLERNQTSTLAIDVSILVDPDAAGVLDREVEPIRLDTDAFDYETQIETDIFGTKASDGLPPADESGDTGTGDGTADGEADGGDETATETGSPTRTETSTASPTETSTATAPETQTGDGGHTETATETATETETDDGILPLE